MGFHHTGRTDEARQHKRLALQGIAISHSRGLNTTLERHGGVFHLVSRARSVGRRFTRAFSLQKVYKNWINNQLRPANMRIEDLIRDISTGTVLIRLVETLSGTKCNFAYKSNPTNRTFMIDNMSIALRFISLHVPGLTIAPADVVDGNEQVILGLIWRLILKWQNVLQEPHGEIGESAASQSVVKKTKDAKQKLLDWIRGKVGQYPHVEITSNFSASFDSGMALCALVHAYDPGLIAFDMLDPNRKLDNLALGMQLSEQFLGVPRMMDPEDVAEADDKVMMVYLYEFPKAFLARLESPSGEIGDEAARRIAAEAEEDERRYREAAAAAEEEARRRAAMEAEETRRRREEEETRRRREEEEAQRRRQQQQQQEDHERQLEAQRLASERERMQMFQQHQQQQPHAGGPPQVITNTVVIHESSNIGRLTVEIIKCRGLKTQDIVTQSATPYVIVQVERQKERTRKEKHTLSPNFNERFTFYVSEPYATVDVCVFDYNMLLSDYFMGKVEYPVNKLQYDVPVEAWFPLQPLHSSGKTVTGDIYLIMHLKKG